MQRNFAFRLTTCRFATAMLAVYALVLQSVLAVATPIPLNASGQAVPLCAPGVVAPASDEAPRPGPREPIPLHTCICLAHCSLTGGFVPAAIGIPVPASRPVMIALDIASSALHRDRFRNRPRARAPPDGLQGHT